MELTRASSDLLAEDWDKEIEEREKMQASVDRFQEGETDGSGEIRAVGSTTSEEEKANNANGAVQKLRGAKDSSGRPVFVEADLPETDLKMNSLAIILGETPFQQIAINIAF